MDNQDSVDLENRLWGAANQLWAGANPKQSEYSAPVLGLIFLKFADARFTNAQQSIEGSASGRRKISKTNYQTESVLYLPEEARYDTSSAK